MYVYVISRAGSGVKIGVSKAPRTRRSKLQVSCPETLTLVASYRAGSRAAALNAEARVKDLLRPWRLKGEWYRCSAEVARVAVEAATDPDERKAAFVPLVAVHDEREAAWEALLQRRDLKAEPAWAALSAISKEIAAAFPDLTTAALRMHDRPGMDNPRMRETALKRIYDLAQEHQTIAETDGAMESS